MFLFIRFEIHNTLSVFTLHKCVADAHVNVRRARASSTKL